MVTEGNMEREYFDLSDRFVPDSPKRRLPPHRPLPVSGAEIIVYSLMIVVYTGIAMWMGALMAASFCG